MDEEEKVPPPGVIVASNGAWRDERTGRIVANPGGGKYAITKDNASDYLQLRRQKKLDGILAANNRLARLAGSPTDAWEEITERMYDLTGNKKSAVAAVQAADMVGKMSGFLASGNARGDAEQVPASGARLTLGPDALKTLLEFISDQRPAEHSPQPGAPAISAGGRAGEEEERE